MKTKPGRNSTAPQLLALAGFVSIQCPSSALASEVGASEGRANGSVALIQPTGIGVAFDVQIQTISSIFLAGRSVDPPQQASNSGTDFAPTAQSFSGGFGKVIVLSDDLVSVAFEQDASSGYDLNKPASTVPLKIVAQFN